MSKPSTILEAPEDLPIYPIRTVAQLSGVDARRLRSWEAEYQLLHPARTRGGHRLYSSRDLHLIQEIRRLVDEEGMSLQGIRGWLAARPEEPAPAIGRTTPSGSTGPRDQAQPNGAGQPSRPEGQPTRAGQPTRPGAQEPVPARPPARTDGQR